MYVSLNEYLIMWTTLESVVLDQVTKSLKSFCSLGRLPEQFCVKPPPHTSPPVRLKDWVIQIPPRPSKYKYCTRVLYDDDDQVLGGELWVSRPGWRKETVKLHWLREFLVHPVGFWFASLYVFPDKNDVLGRLNQRSVRRRVVNVLTWGEDRVVNQDILKRREQKGS